MVLNILHWDDIKRLCGFFLAVILLLSFTSCVGIGDGALFDNIATGEKKESTVNLPESDALCQIYPGMSPGGTVTTKSVDALELFLNLSSENYTTDVERDAMEKPFFELIYSSPSNKHYIVYSDDYVIEKIKKINLDLNTVDNFTSLGQLPGAYDQVKKLYLDTLSEVTDEEKSVGFKLNCLQVKMKPEISRIFYLSDFEDIGGFYLFEIPSQPSISSFYIPAGQFIVYFKSCTPAELEEKLNTVKKMSVVASADKIAVADGYYGTAFAE